MAKLTLTLPQALSRAVQAYNDGRLVEAEQLCRQILAVEKELFDAIHLLAIVQSKLGKRQEALEGYASALKLRPNQAEVLNNLAITLKKLGRYQEALTTYNRALSIRPTYAEALFNRGNLYLELRRLEEAISSYRSATKLQPSYADAHANCGRALQDLRQHEEALVSYERALIADPTHAYVFSGIAGCALQLCDWPRRKRMAAEIRAQVQTKKSIVDPFVLLGYSGDPALQLQCARKYINDAVPSLPRPICISPHWRHDKLRIAYLSADFHEHAIAHLIAELIERHDRQSFEILGISFGVNDRSELRNRLVRAFDQFHDVFELTDEQAARLIHDLQADIAVDLNGYTREARFRIFSYRPAPVQVSYLGYPGTMGTKFVDYIIADKIVAPFEHQQFYDERIVHLPDSYQVNDSRRVIATDVLTRGEADLPERAFIFCCFNNSWKITPEVFSIWMQLLGEIEGSVLWLYRNNVAAAQNLRKEAKVRGIDPSRLVFGDRLRSEAHLARYRLADLFLDTLPYNAHTTASDALWVGLPVLTCTGKSFAGRVTTSLLHAVGVPELVTNNIDEYREMALGLARNPRKLADIKSKLQRNRSTCALFDIDRFASRIEAAYKSMWEIWASGEKPRSFAVN